jgi:hypothetical protein
VKILAVWLLHAYLIAFPVTFMLIFVGYGFMMTHAEPAAWLLDLVLPAAIAVMVTWAMLKLAGRVTRHLVAAAPWARAFLAVEVAAALAIAGYLFWLGTGVSAALAGLGLIAALSGGWSLIKRSEA